MMKLTTPQAADVFSALKPAARLTLEQIVTLDQERDRTTDRVGVDQAAYLGQQGHQPLHLPNHQCHTSLARGCNHRIALGHRQRQRLFTKDLLACSGGGNS